jgi:hypothetical protein
MSTSVSTSNPALVSTEQYAIVDPPEFPGPGVTDIFSAPHGLYYDGKKLLRTIKNGILFKDPESQFRATTQLLSLPLSFFRAAANIFIYIPDIFKTLTIPGIKTMTTVTAVGGIALCTLQTLLEGNEIRKQHKFAKSPANFYSTIKNIALEKDPTKSVKKYLKKLSDQISILTERIPKSLLNPIHNELKELEQKMYDINHQNKLELNPQKIFTNIQPLKVIALRIQLLYFKYKYLKINDKDRKQLQLIDPNYQEKGTLADSMLSIKKARLAQLVKKWLFNDMIKPDSSWNVDTLLSKLSSNDVKTQHEGILKAEELFNSIEIQNKKKILVHILGITSLIITIIALSFVSAGFPVITATTIMLVGFAMAICTYLTNKSILQQNGWSFYPSKIIPQCIRKRFNKNVETKARKDTKHLKPE